MMHFEDSCAICSLEVAKSRVADMGKAIDREVVNMIRKTYVDYGSGGGSNKMVSRLVG